MFLALAAYGIRVFVTMNVSPLSLPEWLDLAEVKAAIIPENQYLVMYTQKGNDYPVIKIHKDRIQGRFEKLLVSAKTIKKYLELFNTAE